MAGHEGVDRRPPPVLGDLHPQARILAEHQAEQWFSILTRKLLRRGSFASQDDPDRQITGRLSHGRGLSARDELVLSSTALMRGRRAGQLHQPTSRSPVTSLASIAMT